MKGYGVHLRVKASQQQKKQIRRPPLPTALVFCDDDDVETEILRQASKNKALRVTEEQQKKALEEDPLAFDYDGVYDQMKEKVARPRDQDREERKPKCIPHMIKAAEKRKKSQKIVNERQHVNEREKEDHRYGDKDKFVTGAYKKKLAEQAEWLEEERLHEIQEEKDDVTNKKNLNDFYFNLGKILAYGANKAESSKPLENAHLTKPQPQQDKVSACASRSTSSLSPTDLIPSSNYTANSERREGESSYFSDSFKLLETNGLLDDLISGKLVQQKTSAEQSVADQQKINHHKRTRDTLADAKQRYLVRKKVVQSLSSELVLRRVEI